MPRDLKPKAIVVVAAVVAVVGIALWRISGIQSPPSQQSLAAQPLTRTPEGLGTDSTSWRAALAQVFSRGSAVQIRVVPPSAIPKSPLLAFLKEYQDAAARGDGEAAFVLARSLYLCKNVPMDDEAKHGQIESLRLDATNKGFNGDAIAQFTNNLSERHEFCAGVDQNLVASWESYLERAAESGSEYAQYQFAHYIPAWVRVDTALLTPDEYSEWAVRSTERAERSLAYLTALRDKNANIQAMEALGAQYYARRHQPDGYFNVYVNFRALEILSDRAREEFLAGKQLSDAQANLSPMELDRAEAFAQRLASHSACCSRFAPGFQWNLGSE